MTDSELPEKIRRALREGTEKTPPESFYQAVLEKIEPRPHPTPLRRWWPVPAGALATACVAMLAVLVGRERMSERLSSPPPPPPAAAPAFKMKSAPRDQRDREISDHVTAILQEAKKKDIPAEVPLKSYSQRAVSRLAAEPVTAASPMASSEAGGLFSRLSAPREVIIRDTEAWQKIWQEHQPGQTPPAMDFSRFMVIGIFLGERPNAGYEVEIIDIKTLPNQLAVEYQELLPEEGRFYAQMIVRPFTWRAIPRTDDYIHFHPLRPRSR